MNKKLVLTVLIVLATLPLAACAPRTTSRALSPEEGAAYAAEVDEIVENMIVGFSENDFAKLTRDMPDHLDEAYEASIRNSPTRSSLSGAPIRERRLIMLKIEAGAGL